MNVLEELRRQRELIREHLDWLEQRIASLESEAEEDTGAAASEKAAPPEAPASEEITPTEASDAPATAPDAAFEQELARHKAPLGNEIQRAKIGCLVLFVCSSLLFLFLLFGLPYLWD